MKLNGKSVRSTRTKQFILKDAGFWKNGKIISRHESLNTLLEADSETLNIPNQKNGRMGQTLYHESTGSKGALASLALGSHHILINKGTEDNLLCDVCHRKM